MPGLSTQIMELAPPGLTHSHQRPVAGTPCNRFPSAPSTPGVFPLLFSCIGHFCLQWPPDKLHISRNSKTQFVLPTLSGQLVFIFRCATEVRELAWATQLHGWGWCPSSGASACVLYPKPWCPCCPWEQLLNSLGKAGLIFRPYNHETCWPHTLGEGHYLPTCLTSGPSRRRGRCHISVCK